MVMTADPEPDTPPAFNRCGGHPALDFVNTLDNRFAADGPVELLGDYGALLRFAAQSQLVEARHAAALAKSVSPAAAARALRAARELREALAAVLYAGVAGRPPASADVLLLEQRFQDASRHRELRWQRSAANTSGPALASWQWGRFARQADLPLWTLAQSASELVLSHAMQRVRACGADTCRWLFLDTSKNHTRRWCDMKVCGNRMKARRFQARQAQ
jgi:predicted RNA-binding Zn ribbon-like protein